ncbi:MAG TPA: glycosyltransferase family 39 protein [Anaerolineales bacterium]|nr:glycosyltransferase family 39 protein [Anaerolineales bacterium]
MNPTYPRLTFFLQRIALVLLSVLPIGFSLFSQLGYLLENWPLSSFFRIGLLIAMLLAPLAAILLRDNLWGTIESTGYIPLVWIVALAVALRLVVLPLLSTNFSSDMQDMHLFAVDVVSGQPFANLETYQGIPWAVHLDMTGLVTSILYRIFGASPTTAKMFMVVLAALTVWLVYLAGKQFAGARAGFIAASLYGTLPSLVCYTGVLSGEHIALLLITLSVLLYGRIKNSETNQQSTRALGYILCGITTGLIDWFRPGGIILLTALLISDLIYLARDKALYKQLIPLGLLVISYLAVSNTAVLLAERFFQTDIMSAFQQRGHFILLGLNPEHKGVINNPDREIAFDAYERFGDDNAAANGYLIQLAIDRLEGYSVLELFRSKFDLIWSNHWQLFQVSLNGSNDHEVVRVMSDIDSFLYLIITIFIGVNIVTSFINRPRPAVFVMQLFLLGFAISSLILEAQNRYGIITFPYQILLGSLGMSELAVFVLKRGNRSSL